jgi:hypothetical protein
MTNYFFPTFVTTISIEGDDFFPLPSLVFGAVQDKACVCRAPGTPLHDATPSSSTRQIRRHRSGHDDPYPRRGGFLPHDARRLPPRRRDDPLPNADLGQPHRRGPSSTCEPWGARLLRASPSLAIGPPSVSGGTSVVEAGARASDFFIFMEMFVVHVIWRTVKLDSCRLHLCLRLFSIWCFFFCREPSLAHVKDFSPRVRRKVHGKGPLPGNLLPCGICRAMQCPEKRTSNTLPCVFTSNPVFPVVCDHGSL